MTGPDSDRSRRRLSLLGLGCALILAAIGVFALDGAQYDGRRLQIARLTCIDLATQTEGLLHDAAALGRVIIGFSGLPGAVERLQPMFSAGISDRPALWRIVMVNRTGEILLDTRPSSPAPMLASGPSLVAVAADNPASSTKTAWRRPNAELVRASFAAGQPPLIGISVRSDSADAPARVVNLLIHGRDLPHPEDGIGRILLIGDDGVALAELGEEGDLEANAAMAQGWRALPAQSRRSGSAVLAMADGDHVVLTRHLQHWPAAVLIDTGASRLFWIRPPVAIALGLLAAGLLALIVGSRLIGRLRARWRGGVRAVVPEPVRSLERETTQRRFSAGVAHEINNALTILLLDAEMVAAVYSGDAELALLSQSMLAAGARASVLSQTLLAYSERAVLRPRQIDIAAALRRLVPKLEEVVFQGQRLICTGFDRDDITLSLDPDALQACLFALLRNAAEASGPHADICIDLKLVVGNAGPTAVLTVADQGHGMSADERMQALEPGFSSRAGGHHLGLGLPAAAGFARQSGGRLSLESQPGFGSRISLLLPVAGGPMSAPLPAALLSRPPGRRWPAVRALPVEAGRHQRVRVLLVDDSADVRDSVARRLRADGYEVLEAHNSSEAMALVAQGVDALVTDIVLDDGTDGYALAVRARAICPGLPLVFMSGYMSARNPGLLIGDELANFVRKPVNGAELQTVLVGLLALRDSWRHGGICTLSAEISPDLAGQPLDRPRQT
jgi:signal transduction histidine kinase/DNA-binding NarL/FixJ family response regulator